MEGFSAGTSIAPANLATTTDLGTYTAAGTLTSSFVVRTGSVAPNADTNGGVLLYPNTADKTVALSAVAANTTPHLVFHLNTTGKAGWMSPTTSRTWTAARPTTSRPGSPCSTASAPPAATPTFPRPT